MNKKIIAFCALVATAISGDVRASRTERCTRSDYRRNDEKRIVPYTPKTINRGLTRTACQPAKLGKVKPDVIAYPDVMACNMFGLSREFAEIANSLHAEARIVASILHRHNDGSQNLVDSQNLVKQITRQVAAVARQYAYLQTSYHFNGYDLGWIQMECHE
ncbi:MAG: hypothetical protein LBD43_01175 [Holosporales bacterium]|jgi:hypothetical protein|nr:hypothetical protein [Holosporales bacterium]